MVFPPHHIAFWLALYTRQDFISASFLMEEIYENGGELLIEGNGGSAADSEHIAGELIKQFKIFQPVSKGFAAKLRKVEPVRDAELAKETHMIQELHLPIYHC